jgi:hypothetical protein
MATSIAIQSSGDSPENHAKIAGKSHASVYDIVTERILEELETTDMGLKVGGCRACCRRNVLSG